MKKTGPLFFVILFAGILSISNPGYGQENPMGKFALSVNPLGFMEFGPLINAEFGLTDNLVLNTHVRFHSLGLLSYVIDDWPDRLTGIAMGAGLLHFFGSSMHKPYVGGLIELHHSTQFYLDDGTGTTNMAIFIANGGYRFRFDSGFFINTGLFMGFGAGPYTWASENYPSDDYTDLSVVPFGMAELTLGFEF
ncbi:MAG: hypothetical protein ABFS10_03640 [Bacteroidota bacterium]